MRKRKRLKNSSRIQKCLGSILWKNIDAGLWRSVKMEGGKVAEIKSFYLPYISLYKSSEMLIFRRCLKISISSFYPNINKSFRKILRNQVVLCWETRSSGVKKRFSAHKANMRNKSRVVSWFFLFFLVHNELIFLLTRTLFFFTKWKKKKRRWLCARYERTSIKRPLICSLCSLWVASRKKYFSSNLWEVANLYWVSWRIMETLGCCEIDCQNFLIFLFFLKWWKKLIDVWMKR